MNFVNDFRKQTTKFYSYPIHNGFLAIYILKETSWETWELFLKEIAISENSKPAKDLLLIIQKLDEKSIFVIFKTYLKFLNPFEGLHTPRN